MKKIVLTIVFIVIFCSTVFAGAWQFTQGKWYYIKDNNTLAMNEWINDDYNHDGIIEWYYFDANAQMLYNTTTPDGYQVGADGNRIGAADTGVSNETAYNAMINSIVD